LPSDPSLKNSGNQLVLVATLLLTLLLVSGVIIYLWNLLHEIEQRQLNEDFQIEVTELTTAIASHMDAYEQVLKGGRSFFMASEHVSRDAWHTYVENLQLNLKYPGIQGVGYAALVPAAELAAHEQQIRSKGFPDYRIWPEGKRDTYTGIIFLEPFDWRNQRAFGYDMFAEATRHEAMARARDTGIPALSGKVLLVQETDEAPQAGTLLYVPFYRKGVPLDSVVQRQQALLGWVYSPYRMSDLLQGMLRNRDQGLRLRIYDQQRAGSPGSEDPDALLYDSLPTGSADSQEGPYLAHTDKMLVIAGRSWLLDFVALPGFAKPAETASLNREMGGIGLIGLLLIVLIWSLVNTQRRAVELANHLTSSLREKEEKFESLISNMNEGLALHEMVYDAEGRAIDYRILDINAAYEHHTGLVASQVEGQLGSKVYGVTPAPYLEEFGAVAESGDPYHFDTYFPPLDRHFDISVFSPGPHQFATVFTDITERKQAEKALQESESTFRAMAETIPLAIYVSTGQEQTADYLNPTFIRLFGYTLEEIPSVSEWWPKAYPDEVYRKQLETEWQARVELAIQTQSEIEPMETVVTCKDGSKKNILWGFVTLGEKNYAFGLDLTERKQSEEASRKLAQVVEQAGESILITDRDGIIEYVNPSFTTITGYSAEEVIGKNPKILNSGQQSAEFYETMWSTISSGRVWHVKIIDRRKDGSFYPAMMTISPIRNESGEITHFVGLQQDLSENEELETKFYQAQKMEALGTLVGGIAHEFNNALAGMTGNLYLARSKVADMPEVTAKLDTIEKLAFRSAELIRNLLSFARKGIVQKTSFDLSDHTKESLKMHKISLPEDITLDVEIEETTLPVNWDANLLQQVVMNLLNNARDACRDTPNPTITVRLHGFSPDAAFLARHPELEAGEFACLAINDNGIGISAERLPHVFEPLYTTKEIGQGTGLGLSMVLGAVQTHQGCIEVDSIEGIGSAFRLYLPLQKHETAVSQQLQESPEHGNGELILLADDDAHMLDVGRQVLESLGYRVISALDGLEAVEMFKAHRDDISLVLSDIMMPRMGGMKAVERIREIRPDIKVIFTTGYNREEERLADMQSDEAVLHKPYGIEELSRTIKNILSA